MGMGRAEVDIEIWLLLHSLIADFLDKIAWPVLHLGLRRSSSFICFFKPFHALPGHV